MKIMSNEAVPSEPTAYGRLISRSVIAARSRLHMNQSSLAARMKALGHGWYPQTVGTVERGERRLTPDEILSLALALETSVGALLDPTTDDRLIELPSGDVILAKTVVRSVRHFNDGMVSWDGDKPRFATREPETWPDTEIGRDLREEVRELSEFGDSPEDMIERNARLHPGPFPDDYPPPPRRRPDRGDDR
jgi:hypothetical protein